jgi:tripeptide aminopeptidase
MLNEKRLLDLFLRLVTINGPSGDEKDVADFVEADLKSIGFEVRRDNAGEKIGGSTGNVIGFMKGSIHNACPITLNAHMDTVAPTDKLVCKIEDGVIRSSGDTILGADDRAGIAVILEGLRSIYEDGAAHGDIQVIFTIGEESGLYGARYLDPKIVASKFVYVLDSGKPVGGIATSAPYQDNIVVKYHGKAAHAGSDPEQGISAIKAACGAIARMNLGRIDFETTANVGVITGGAVTNIVPEYCEVKAEARSRDESKLLAQTEHMVEAFHEGAADVGAGVDIEVNRSYSGYKLALDDQIVVIATEAARSIGIEPYIHGSGGGSDANILNSLGIPAATIGVGYERPHGVEEYQGVDDLVKSAELVLALMRTASQAAQSA